MNRDYHDQQADSRAEAIIRPNEHQPWTEWEDSVLRASAGHKDFRALASRLARSYASVYSRYYKIRRTT
jgi:hypothetical protein